MRKKIKVILFLIVIISGIMLISGCADISTAAGSGSEEANAAAPIDSETTTDEGAGPLAQLLGSRSQALQLVGMLTILSLAPSVLIMLTGFVRIIIVLSFTRQAMGLQQTPPNQVLIVLALFLTFFVMAPVLNQIKEDAIDPYLEDQLTFDEAIDRAEVPLRTFMLRQTYRTDLNMFLDYAPDDRTTMESVDDIPMTIVVPAFLTSEIKRAFTIGFLIYIPFIVIDMVVASVLMAMGMMMLPPVTISLPFKVMLFVLVDGWTLTIESLITSFT